MQYKKKIRYYPSTVVFIGKNEFSSKREHKLHIENLKVH